jgi:hypothetical protein
MLTEVAAEPQVNDECELQSWVLAAETELAPTNAIAAMAATAARPSVLTNLIFWFSLLGGLPPSWFLDRVR